MIFDTHAHYDAEPFDADRDAVLASLPDRGGGLVIDPGCDAPSSRNRAFIIRPNRSCSRRRASSGTSRPLASSACSSRILAYLRCSPS